MRVHCFSPLAAALLVSFALSGPLSALAAPAVADGAEAATESAGVANAEGDEDEEPLEDGRARYPHPASVPMVIPDFDQPQYPPEVSAPRERHRWVWDNLTVGRINPLGAINRFTTGYRLQLFDAPGVLFERSFAALKLVTELAPSFGRVGGRVELQPLAVLNLSAQHEFHGSFGIFSNLKSYDSLSEEFSDTAQDDEERRSTYTGLGEATTLSALFQVMAFSIALRNGFKAYWQRMDLREGDTLSYNPSLDLLHPNRGWAISNDLDLIVVSDFGLKLGARYTFTHAFYPDDLSDEADVDELVPTHRVGPAILYTFFEDPPGTGWNTPTVGVLAQWWAKHPYRTGRDTSAALPYILLLLTQKGDFAP